MSKITIIGAGSVGATIAYTMVVNGTASEIVMIDINGGKISGRGAGYPPGNAFLRASFHLCGKL